jgi:hypothetical protein
MTALYAAQVPPLKVGLRSLPGIGESGFRLLAVAEPPAPSQGQSQSRGGGQLTADGLANQVIPDSGIIHSLDKVEHRLFDPRPRRQQNRMPRSVKNPGPVHDHPGNPACLARIAGVGNGHVDQRTRPLYETVKLSGGLVA